MKNVLVLIAFVGSLTGCHWTTVISVDTTGQPAPHSSLYPTMSADGRYVAFQASASNLVANDTNSTPDIFLRDTRSGITTRVSVDSDGNQANGISENPAISANGRYVSFNSRGTNLVPGDTNNDTDIFVHDRMTGETSRVSVDSNGVQANQSSFISSISDDGRFVAFNSAATNLVSGDTNSETDIFVHDRSTGNTERVSVNYQGLQVYDESRNPNISGDGRYVAFNSQYPFYVPNDNNGVADVFVYDRNTTSVSRVSVNSDGDETVGGFGSGILSPFSLSEDGRFIVFSSSASNLVEDDNNGAADIFVRDQLLGVTSRVSVDSAGSEGSDHSRHHAAISADGRFVVFKSDADDLVAVDTNSSSDIFVRDLRTQTTRRVSLDATGNEGNGNSSHAAISANGRYVAFNTGAKNLGPSNNTMAGNIVMRAIPAPTVTAVVPDMLPIAATTSVTLYGSDFFPDAIPFISGITKSNIVIVDENTITLDLTVGSTQAVGARDIGVNLFGSGPGILTGSSAVCEGCITLF
jgi:archaellum component FlaF (FlaF/FlaG flagellin family)